MKEGIFLNIRRATASDLNEINRLLLQVLNVHHKGRPDLFKSGTKKYTDDELLNIISDDNRPVFVATENNQVYGYVFCIFKQHINNNILTDIKTLYIDDLCIDESQRKKHIGQSLYEYVLNFAKTNNCYNLTLNVWACNEGALQFYKKMGMKPQKIEMETIL